MKNNIYHNIMNESGVQLEIATNKAITQNARLLDTVIQLKIFTADKVWKYNGKVDKESSVKRFISDYKKLGQIIVIGKVLGDCKRTVNLYEYIMPNVNQ